MKLLLIFLLVLKVSSQICVNLQETGEIITHGSAPYNWSIKAVTQIYNAQDNLVAFTTFTSTGPSARHYGEIKIYDLSTGKFGPTAQLRDHFGDTEYALAEYLVNLPNSNYISVQVNWSNKFYVRTFDLSLHTISIIYNQKGRTFFPGNNGNLIFIPYGNTLQFYNVKQQNVQSLKTIQVVTKENYQNITSGVESDIVWACESANYYILALGAWLVFYDMNGQQQKMLPFSAIPFSGSSPIQVKPYYNFQSGTFIATTKIYAAWVDEGVTYYNYITNINTEDFSIEHLMVSTGKEKFLNCATGSPTNLELICANDSSIMYLQNTQIQNTTSEFTHYQKTDLFTTTNSIYYANSYYGIGQYDFSQCDGSNNK